MNRREAPSTSGRACFDKCCPSADTSDNICEDPAEIERRAVGDGIGCNSIPRGPLFRSSEGTAVLRHSSQLGQGPALSFLSPRSRKQFLLPVAARASILNYVSHIFSDSRPSHLFELARSSTSCHAHREEIAIPSRGCPYEPRFYGRNKGSRRKSSFFHLAGVTRSPGYDVSLVIIGVGAEKARGPRRNKEYPWQDEVSLVTGLVTSTEQNPFRLGCHSPEGGVCRIAHFGSRYHPWPDHAITPAARLLFRLCRRKFQGAETTGFPRDTRLESLSSLSESRVAAPLRTDPRNCNAIAPRSPWT